MFVAIRPIAAQHICHVAAVAATVGQGHVAVAISRLSLAARAAPRLRMQRQVLAMAFAAGAQAPLQQHQSWAQAMVCDDLVAVGGATVASRQHAVGTAKAFPGRYIALVGADRPQGQVLAAGVE